MISKLRDAGRSPHLRIMITAHELAEELRLTPISLLPEAHELQAKHPHLNCLSALRNRLDPLEYLRPFVDDPLRLMDMMLVTNSCITGLVADVYFGPVLVDNPGTLRVVCCGNAIHFLVIYRYLQKVRLDQIEAERRMSSTASGASGAFFRGKKRITLERSLSCFPMSAGMPDSDYPKRAKRVITPSCSFELSPKLGGMMVAEPNNVLAQPSGYSVTTLALEDESQFNCMRYRARILGDSSTSVVTYPGRGFVSPDLDALQQEHFNWLHTVSWEDMYNIESTVPSFKFEAARRSIYDPAQYASYVRELIDSLSLDRTDRSECKCHRTGPHATGAYGPSANHIAIGQTKLLFRCDEIDIVPPSMVDTHPGDGWFTILDLTVVLGLDA